MRCRRDFDVHNMWAKLNFVPLNEVQGRSHRGYPLTIWAYEFHPTLFDVASSERIPVGIDTNVLFDFDESDRPGSPESEHLLNEWVTEELELVLTEETYQEIDRSDDPQRRASRRARATCYRTVRANPDSWRPLFKAAKDGATGKFSAQDDGDLRHLAMASAAG